MNQAENVGKSKYFNLTKNHLINYRFYKATIERGEQRAEELSQQAEGIRATDYTADRVQTTPQNLIEKLIAEKIQVEDKLRKAKALVADIDRALDELEPVDKEILELKYMDRHSISNGWIKVAQCVGYEERQCRRRADNSINKISFVIYEGMSE